MRRRQDRIVFAVVSGINVFVVCGLVWLLGAYTGGVIGAAVCWFAADAGTEIFTDAKTILRGSKEHGD